MAKRIKNTEIGDVFSAPISSTTKRYLHYVVSDLTQLNSDVIRAFKKEYLIEENPTLEEIVSGEIDFYLHCDSKAGIRNGFWEKVGNIADIGDVHNILFRSKRDWTISKGKVDDDWWVWHPNQSFIHVGKLSKENKKADLGLVFHAEDVMNKLKTGSVGNIFSHFE